MKKKSLPVFTQYHANVDEAAGVIKGVVILQGGIDKVGDNFDTTSLQQLTDLGNSQEMGVKCRFGHPTACADALGTYIGRYKNFSISNSGEGRTAVVADLYLDPVAKESPRGDLYSYTLSMAKNNPDMFGNSIVYHRDEPYVSTETKDGQEITTVYERIKSFIASDVVDSPAATTNLFKSAEDFSALATEFLDDNPQIFELISKDESIVTDFLQRFNHYKSEKQKMATQKKSLPERVKDAVRNVFAEAKSETKKEILTVVLTSGDEVYVDDIDMSGSVSIGDVVIDGAGNLMANAELETNDGMKLYTDENGVITEIDTPEVAMSQAAAEEVKTLKDTVSSLMNQLSAAKSEMEAENAKLQNEVERLKAILSAVQSKGVTPAATQSFKSVETESNVVAAAIERRKNKVK